MRFTYIQIVQPTLSYWYNFMKKWNVSATRNNLHAGYVVLVLVSLKNFS